MNTPIGVESKIVCRVLVAIETHDYTSNVKSWKHECNLFYSRFSNTFLFFAKFAKLFWVTEEKTGNSIKNESLSISTQEIDILKEIFQVMGDKEKNWKEWMKARG